MSPEVQAWISKTLKTTNRRVRIAFPLELDFESVSKLCQLEIYDVHGEPLQSPILLTELDEEGSAVIQVEIFHMLLKERGLDIPLW